MRATITYPSAQEAKNFTLIISINTNEVEKVLNTTVRSLRTCPKYRTLCRQMCVVILNLEDGKQFSMNKLVLQSRGKITSRTKSRDIGWQNNGQQKKNLFQLTKKLHFLSLLNMRYTAALLE